MVVFQEICAPQKDASITERFSLHKYSTCPNEDTKLLRYNLLSTPAFSSIFNVRLTYLSTNPSQGSVLRQP